MNKHMLCALTIILAGNVTHAFVSEPFIEQPTRLLEYIVHEKPQQSSLMKELKKLVPVGILAGLIGKITHDKVYSCLQSKPDYWSYCYRDDINLIKIQAAEKLYQDSMQAKVLSSGIALISSVILYAIADQIMHRKQELDVMVDFIKEWPQHKRNMPGEFHAIGDILYEMYLAEGTSSHFKKEVREAINIMKFVLNEYHKQERRIDAERKSEQTNTTHQYKYIKSETVA